MSFDLNNNYFITLDCDWASSEMIISVANILLQKKVKATWFVTDDNEGIDFLKSYPENFELGIHPNFMANSTQGKDVDSVMKYMISVVANPISMRTHGLFQYSNLFIKMIWDYGLGIDSSIFLPYSQNIQPFAVNLDGKDFLRVPYQWGDFTHLNEKFSLKEVNPILYNHQGLKVYNFHPIHIYYNTPNQEYYSKIKLNRDIKPYENLGVRNFFNYLISSLENEGKVSKKLNELHEYKKYYRTNY